MSTTHIARYTHNDRPARFERWDNLGIIEAWSRVINLAVADDTITKVEMWEADEDSPPWDGRPTLVHHFTEPGSAARK